MTDSLRLNARQADCGLVRRVFSRDALFSLVILVLLPNLLFLVVSPWLMVRRIVGPFLYLAAGFLSLFLPKPLSYLFYLAAAAIDGFIIVALAFDMPFDLAFASLRFVSGLNVSTSLLYVGATAYFGIAACLVAHLVNANRERLRASSLIPALLAAFFLYWVDLSTNQYKSKPTEFQSAMQQAGLTSENIVARDRNVLFVLVEGLGAYADPNEREILAGKLRSAAGDRFIFKSGINTHYGSTTGAMSRELCGKWGTFLDYLDNKPHDCLPARLAKANFETINYDAYDSALFALRDWYPRIGIQRMNFGEDIEQAHPELAQRHCGTVLRGLCDDDMGEVVKQELAKSSSKRKFVYWLTLNSHLPYEPRRDGPLKCREKDAVIASLMTCELTEIWMAVFDKIAAIAADPTMPPVDILVVGDHNTPMWSRAEARHFIPGRVDWYYLQSRATPTTAAAQTLTPD